MVQWGGSDFSVSIGKPGQRNDPEVMAAHDKVFKDSIAAGVHARAEIQSPDDARRYLDMGVRHFSIGDRHHDSARLVEVERRGPLEGDQRRVAGN